MQTTFEQVFQDVQSLPLEEQRLLIDLVEPPKTLAELAEEQGVKPFNFAEASNAAMFWPEDESVDEFVSTVRAWRQDAPTEKS